MSKRAFLVGINKFTRSDWTLRGCVNDTIAMQEILKTYFGFQDEDIKVIHDRDATSRGIRDGLGWLLSGYDGGDVRIFHFSSHGTQVPDDSDDEVEVQDEVIVPFDHDWKKPFRDDDLRKIFDPIPPKVNFTFVADCCHSGSIQKAVLDSGVDFKPRYVDPPEKIKAALRAAEEQRDSEVDDYIASHLLEMLEGVPKEQRAAKTKEYIALLRKQFRQNKFAVVPAEKNFLLAACEDRQTAADAHIDADYHGAFTWALTKAVKKAHGNLTYDDLIGGIGANLQQYDQRPQLECPAGIRTWKLFAPLA
jgi:metacaspase-1